MEYVKLNNGVDMPVLGFGVYRIDNKALCERCVGDALTMGYRLFDAAAAYGNEDAVGNVLRQCGVPRQELFVTTKVWVQDAGYEATLKAFERSLKNLRTDYIDLYMIHQPYGDVYGSWRAMEKLYAEGQIRALGVSNFAADRLVDLLLHNTVMPTVDQVETHPLCQQREVAASMAEYGVQHQAWAPFAQGGKNIFQHPVLGSVAEKHQKSVPQVMLRWLRQRGVVAIPKTVRRERMAENIAIFDFHLDQDDMARIEALDTGASVFFSHRDPRAVKGISCSRID